MSDLHLSKFLSLILRHKPDVIGLTLDNNGWANVEELISGINRSKNIDMKLLEKIVEEDDKQRYVFNEDKTKIRASQGHSINIDLQLKPVKPPHVLYHGTAERFLNSILNEGLTCQKRQYVHLSRDFETAYRVGNRHGKSIVLSIDSKSMYDHSYEFYLSENKVWLTENVPCPYISLA